MQNFNTLSRPALSSARRVTLTAPIPIEAVTLTSVHEGDADQLGVRGSMRCRWRAAADGELRMQWLNTAE
jgi:hypothetical protein